MPKPKFLASQTSGENVGVLQINIPNDTLGTFLSGLLGQQRTIEKNIFSEFEVDHDFLCHLDSLIDQRIVTHQEASLVSLAGKVETKESRVHSFSSRNALKTFDELSNSPTTKVGITWAYLVKFPHKPTPEKQEIELSIDTGNVRKKLNSRNSNATFNALSRAMLGTDGPEINIKVGYTDLIWGTEVIRHIEDEIRKKCRDDWKYVRAFKSNFGFFAPMISMTSIFLGPVMLLEALEKTRIDIVQQKLLIEIAKTPDFQSSVLKKLDFLMANKVSFQSLSSVQFWAVAAVVLMVNVGMWMYLLKSNKSYLLLNNAARDEKISNEKRSIRLRNGFFLTIAISVVAGVIGNKLTTMMDTFLN